MMVDDARTDKIPLLVLAGPTAVGKTALAMEVAQALQTEIVSADSAQIYRDLDIGTAKPSAAEQRRVIHHLIDMVYPDQAFSVADYQKAAFRTIKALWQEGKLPFMVGGTGLYIRAVIDAYAFGAKGANPQIRATLSALAEARGTEYLHRQLEGIDPHAAAAIHPRDSRRIIRALEVYSLEGKPISEQVSRTRQEQSPYQVLFFGLRVDRDILYRRIEERVDLMIQQGFLEEVRSLYHRGYGENSPGMQILGYRQLLAYLQGRCGWEETVAEIKKQTRNLAKRQLTWFRRDEALKWLDYGANDEQNHAQDQFKEIICLKVKEILTARANNT